MRDIVRIGRQHLATDGAAALSLRAVARDLGLVSSAVYRYVASRDELLTLLVVDGYVHLDPQGRPGLGAYAHDAFGVPVIGVAKTAFHSATHAVEVRRGDAVRPLYVTAVGVDADGAAELVRRMAGRYRLPDALRRVDALSRGR